MYKIMRNTKEIIKSTLMDIGPADATIILAGMGRSGTTWATNIINYDSSYRILFEPFYPQVVKEANKFEYIHYIPPACNDNNLSKQAKNIISGKTSNRWVDKENKSILYRKRIIKDIRCNLMLGWLKNMFPKIPLILMVRHPLQVTESWLKLGWGNETRGERSDFEIITSQENLLIDFPIIRKVLKIIDTQDIFETILFEWCVLHHVPSQQLTHDDVYVLYYENLLLNPEEEIRGLFQYLDRPFKKYFVTKAFYKSSRTNYHQRDFSKGQYAIINSWMSTFTMEQIKRANNLLSIFGFENLYDNEGLPNNILLR